MKIEQSYIYVINQLNNMLMKSQIKRNNNRKLLTREEMWLAIKSKYPSLEPFFINCNYGSWSRYISRPQLLRILLEMNIHKSRHLTKKQKMKIKYEQELKIVEAI